MEKFRKVIAALLVLVMALGVMATAFAETSPTQAPLNPGYDADSDWDVNEQDHDDNVVTTAVYSDEEATVLKVTSENTAAGKVVEFSVARDFYDDEVAITNIGDGGTGVFNSKTGRYVTKVNINSDAAVTIDSYAFKGSKVKTINLTSKKVTINAKAFSGTKVKNPKIYIKGSKKKASAFTFKKNAFSGLSKNERQDHR